MRVKAEKMRIHKLQFGDCRQAYKSHLTVVPAYGDESHLIRAFMQDMRGDRLPRTRQYCISTKRWRSVDNVRSNGLTMKRVSLHRSAHLLRDDLSLGSCP